MDNIEEIKIKLLKAEKVEIKPITIDKQFFEDLRRDFQKENKTQDFLEECDKLKKDFHVVITSLKKLVISSLKKRK